MLINSLQFVIFVIAVVVIYAIAPKKIKWLVLLISSYIYYFANSTYLTICILITTLSIYLITRKIQSITDNTKKQAKEIKDKEQKKAFKEKAKKKKKIVLTIGILINLGILVFLKYSGFIGESINSLLKIIHVDAQMGIHKFILPIGISYYTLQAIGYMVDVYREKVKADKNLGKVALFLAFFPQIMQGPIGRYDELADNLYEPHKITYKNLTYGSQLMLWGYFKKIVVADRVAIYVNEVFSNYTEYKGIVLILAVLGYTLQIYAEFSGGIDIVRGVAQVLGIRLRENFERPFFSKSVDEFWRRWNITLGTWLKDYVFYPVSLSKASMTVTSLSKKIFKTSYFSKIVPIAFSLLAVWVCNGLWHGAGTKYLVYGLYYYAIMMSGKIFKPVFDKIIKTFKINTEVFSYRFFQVMRTAMFVCIGMLIFRATTLRDAAVIFRNMFRLGDLSIVANGQFLLLGGLKVGDVIITIISCILILGVGLYQEKRGEVREFLSKQNLLFRWGILYVGIFAIVIFGIYGSGYNVQDFIYGQF